MLRRKLGVGRSHFIRRFADYLDTTDYGVLRSTVPVEGLNIHGCDITQRTIDCIQYVLEIFGNPAPGVWTSYRYCFKQYSISESLGNAVRGKNIDMHPEQVLRVELNCSQGH
jgi:hypothetical protein